MRCKLIGERGMLWKQPLHREMALTLAASFPSGHADVVHCREAMSKWKVGPGWMDWSGWKLPTIRHLTVADQFIPAGEVYIGGSRPGFVLTPWANPCRQENSANGPSVPNTIRRGRASNNFLYPLDNQVLVCDCTLRSRACHGETSIQTCLHFCHDPKLDAESTDKTLRDVLSSESDGMDERDEVAPHLHALGEVGSIRTTEQCFQDRARAEVPDTERGKFLCRREGRGHSHGMP